MLLAGVARETLVAKQTLHRLLQHGREAVWWSLYPADDEAGAIGLRHAEALVHNMCQVEQMESPRAEDDPDCAIGKRPWMIAVGLQQARHCGWEKPDAFGKLRACGVRGRHQCSAAVAGRAMCRSCLCRHPLRGENPQGWLLRALARLVRPPGSAARAGQHAGHRFRPGNQNRLGGGSSLHYGRWRRSRSTNRRRTSVPSCIPEGMAWPRE
jgi:hypothetical protein